jgi:circadian clock protein KaiC
MFAFEESEPQLVRNMRSAGIDLKRWTDDGLLHIMAARPTLTGLEAHLAMMHKRIRELKPRAVIVDPVSNLVSAGTGIDTQAMLLRLVDHLKSGGITALLTDLTSGAQEAECTDVGVSSLIDTWIVLEHVESAGERRRCLHVLKSRGTKHSSQTREFQLTESGVRILATR